MSSHLYITGLASVVLLLLLLGIIKLVLSKRLQDPFGVFILGFGVFYVFRALLISSGLDTPSPDYLFATTDVGALVTKTTLALCMFLAILFATAFLITQRRASGPGLMFHGGELDIRRLVGLTLFLTALGVLAELYLFAQFGNFGAVVRASKVDGKLAGLYYLKTPCALGALVATATFLELRAKFAAKRGLRLLMLGSAILDSILVFSWGQRGVLVIVAAMLVLVGNRDRGPKPGRSQGGSMVRIVIASLVVIFLAVFLRDIRDGFTDPGGTHSFAQESLLRRASQGLNGTYYDASMLAFRDWPARHEFREGLDFWNGLAGAVPRKLWSGKPDPQPGKWFRQIYEPEVINGWPVGAPTIWYLNFGWLGVAIGGIVSGLVIGQISRRYAAAPWSGMNVAMTFSLMVFVVSLGWESQTPFVWLKSAVPLLVLMRLMVLPARRGRVGRTDERTARADPEDGSPASKEPILPRPSA